MPAPGKGRLLARRIRLEAPCPVCGRLQILVGAWPLHRVGPAGILVEHLEPIGHRVTPYGMGPGVGLVDVAATPRGGLELPKDPPA